MRIVLLSSAALAALAGHALAADLPARAAAPAPYYAPAPVFSWTGFYIGVNAGGAFNSSSSGAAFSGVVAGAPVATAGFAVAPTATDPGAGVLGAGAFPIVGAPNANNRSNSGFTGGGQIGYNLQFGQFVLGLEADIQGISRSSRNNSGFSTAGDVVAPVAATASYHVYGAGDSNTRSNYFDTVRGRIGYAFDRVLVFATGGLAYTGDSKSNTAGAGGYFDYYAPGAVNPDVFTNGTNGFNNNNNQNIGYAVGGGFEYAFTNNLTAKLEYLYANLGGHNNNVFNPNGVYANAATGATLTVTGATPGVYTGSGDRNRGLNVVRVGLNYKFGSPAPAVVAKY